jgi:hypothetical protein
VELAAKKMQESGSKRNGNASWPPRLMRRVAEKKMKRDECLRKNAARRTRCLERDRKRSNGRRSVYGRRRSVERRS